MREKLLSFINQKSFPCLMARAVARQGYFQTCEIEDLRDSSLRTVLDHIYPFITHFREHRDELSSFALIIKNQEEKDFGHFEVAFWEFLARLNEEDKKVHPPDPRVDPHSEDKHFSFSLMSEAFFLIVLHPESPRWSRRFSHPAIIFNPHVQFEEMREKGIYKKVRDVIRLRDELLQGAANPMLEDFGEKSEVFQYLGRPYGPKDDVPLHI